MRHTLDMCKEYIEAADLITICDISATVSRTLTKRSEKLVSKLKETE